MYSSDAHTAAGTAAGRDEGTGKGTGEGGDAGGGAHAHGSISILPIFDIVEVEIGDDLGEVLAAALRPSPNAGLTTSDRTPERQLLIDGDVVVVTQKIVSKAEGRLVDIDEATPEAKIALVESESRRILRRRGELLISETAHGFVCANAGVDLSNTASGVAALLPVDPDRSARRLRSSLRRVLGVDVAVIISDTFGRAWRMGVTDVAIGAAGLRVILDLRGTLDATGRELIATEICIADELAGAAELVMGKDRHIPAAIVRGIPHTWLGEGSVMTDVVRPPAEDLFR